MQILTIKIENPDDTNFILGQTHFIKSVEDIHEALVGAVPGIKKVRAGLHRGVRQVPGAVVRHRPGPDRTDEENATAIGAGHSFILFLGDGFLPLNVLNTLKMVPDVCRRG